MFRKLLGFMKSKIFIVVLLLIFAIILSVLFWVWGSSISFNEFYIFGNPYLRFGIIFIFWLVIFLVFFIKPMVAFFASLKSEKRQKIKEFKKESNAFFYKAKRNFFIALKDAKDTWKRKIRFKKLPLVIIIGEEGAGKSSFINYSNVEYPLSDSLHSYKKFHQSTNNFSLYVSKNGALLDTEGNYFSQEKFFTPQTSDEIPEDDIDKNKEYLIKRHIWRNFLSFLNKNFFYNKLNGIVLIVDTQLFFNNPKQYSQDIIRYLTRRVSDCESVLNLRFPIYVVFSKIDLMEGMKEFANIFSDKITSKALGISFNGTINERQLQSDLGQLSQSLFLNFASSNHLVYSLEEKNRIYLFLKQFDNLCALAKDFLLDIQNENAFKNKSYLRGLYFVSAYQENIPRNFLLDGICEKHEIKKALSKPKNFPNKQSYFVKSLLEDIIFRDYALSGMKSIFRKISLFVLILAVGLGTYFLSFYMISKSQSEKQNAQNTLDSLKTILRGVDYNALSINEKVDLLSRFKNIISIYTDKNSGIFSYLSLNLSHKGFVEAKDLYYKLNEDVIKNTILKEMETILKNHQSDTDNLLKTLFLYESLFTPKYLNKDLLKSWINQNWALLSKYHIDKDNFLSGIDDIYEINAELFHKNAQSVEISTKALQKSTTKAQRLYILLNIFHKHNGVYKIKDELGFAANNIFAESSKITSIDRIYTKNGILAFLNNIDKYLENAIEVESWLFGSANDTTKEAINANSVAVLKIYLTQYQQQWKDLLSSLQPKPFFTKESLLNELNILSKSENPMKHLINIVSTNTNLNDALLLAEAYNIGINANEIKSLFSNITRAFSSYHTLLEQDSNLISKASATLLNAKNDSTKIMDIIELDIKNIQNKIIDFGNNAQDSEIAYALNISKKDSDDAFVIFANDIKNLPIELENYYSKLYLYAWNLIESRGIDLLNNAWFNEITSIFINDIAPFYPFNDKSMQELRMDSFKSFFGRNGALNRFYDKYLQSILTKRQNAYVLNSQFSGNLPLSKSFLDFMSECYNLANLMLDSNDNIKVDFTIRSLDLSADFSHIELAYNDNYAKYDHTANSTIRIIGEQFSDSTNFSLSVFDYHNSSVSYQQSYSGEWAWYRLLKENYGKNTYSVIFNDNEKLYFDFELRNGNDAKKIIALPSKIKIVESITKREGNNDR